MRLSPILLLAPAALAAPLGTAPASVPTVREAAVQARRLLRSENIATLSTIFPKGEPHGLDGLPVGLMDYYADCSADGSPTLLAVGIATSFKNAKEGAPIALSIREHAKSWSRASQPRLSLIGHLSEPVPRDSEEAERLKQCFLAQHPDAALWSPGNRIHESDWVTFEVETIFLMGGFGDVAYIGFIPLELYSSVAPKGIDAMDGALRRGWRSFKSFFAGEL